MARAAASNARTQLAAAYCVDRVQKSSNEATELAALKKTEIWDRGEFVKKAGWVTLPGTNGPVSDAADVCAQQLMNITTAQSATVPIAK